MHFWILLLVQAVSSAPAEGLDLQPPATGCAAADPGEVVVCGSRTERSRYRLPEISTQYERKPMIAETQLAPGVNGRVVVESVEMLGGQKSDRAMIRLTFGL